MQKPWPWFYPELFARLIIAAGLGAVLAGIALRIPDPVRAAGASLGAFLLASPVLHPWYLLWVLPFAALYRNAAFLYLSVAVVFGYALLHPVSPFSPGLVLALEYGPFAMLLALDVFRRGRDASTATLRSRQAPPDGNDGGLVGPPRSARGRLRSQREGGPVGHSSQSDGRPVAPKLPKGSEGR
jgi:hypothetical protein